MLDFSLEPRAPLPLLSRPGVAELPSGLLAEVLAEVAVISLRKASLSIFLTDGAQSAVQCSAWRESFRIVQLREGKLAS